jgi:hypothetical protein
MPYMSTEEWIRWVEREEAKRAAPDARRPEPKILLPLAPQAKSATPGSPVRDYTRGGRLPLGYKRVYAPPPEGGRSVATGIEVDQAGATVARELWVQAARGRSIREIERILERRYGSFGVSKSAIGRTLHHELFSNPPQGLEIVDIGIVFEARERLRARKPRRPRGRVVADIIDRRDRHLIE